MNGKYYRSDRRCGACNSLSLDQRTGENIPRCSRLSQRSARNSHWRRVPSRAVIRRDISGNGRQLLQANSNYNFDRAVDNMGSRLLHTTSEKGR